MSLLVYLLKVILVSAIFFGYYRLFLRNKRFHHYNRFFLLGALSLSIVLPFIRIPLLYQPENPVNEVVYRTVAVINSDHGEEEPAMTATAAINEPVFTLINGIYLVYGIGALFLLTLIARSLLYIKSLRKHYAAEKITGLRFYNTQEPGTPFSFFRSVFWNDQLPFNSHEGRQIFRHELFHVQHRHSADRLLSELLTAVFWFNPFFHLIKKELKAIHEFLADQFAVSGSDRYAYATLLVQQALEPGKHSVTNHFFQNHIKRRIAMITQFQKSNYGYWSRVMILPVSLLLFFAITLYAKKPAAGTGLTPAKAVLEQPLTILADAGHGGAGPASGPVDTVPGKEVKEKELLKKRQEQVKEIRKKMQEHETVIKKARLQELEKIKKQMQVQEILRREQEVIEKRQVQELKRELITQQQVVENERKIQRQDLENERKQLVEIESKSLQQALIQKARLAELEILQSKLKEREAELKKEQQEVLEEYRKELRKQQEEKNRLIREKKKGDEQSGLKPQTSHWAMMKEDTLLRNVIRHYHRNLTYPLPARKHSAEGQVYFSVVVDRNGHFKDFMAYTGKPGAKDIKQLVVVGQTPVAGMEENLSLARTEEIFTEEIRLATDRANNIPVAHAVERTYFFKVVFKLEDLNDNTFRFRNTRSFEKNLIDGQEQEESYSKQP